MYKKVIVTGSLAFDHIMSMPGRFSEHILPDKLHILNVSFIMNTFRQEFGGTGGNIAYTLGLLETPCMLVAAAGKDFVLYKRHLAKIKSIGLSRFKVFKKYVTARGFVTTDAGDNQIWGFYEGAMRMAKSLSTKRLLNSDTLLMVAPNDTRAMEKYVDEAIEKNTAYVFDPAFNIPHLSISSLRKAVTCSKVLVGNDYEIELIRRRLKWTKAMLRKSTNILITTKGRLGVKIEAKEVTFNIPAARPKNESDPTGAGDAFRAGFLAGFVRGYPLPVCGKMGAVSAVYTVEKYGTQTHRFTTKEFIKRYSENYPKDIGFHI